MLIRKIKNKYIKFHIFDFITFFSFILSYSLYFLSLEKCFEGFDNCAQKTKWIFIKLYELGVSVIILVVLLECIIFKLISKYHLLHLIFIYRLFFYYSHGLDFHDHGYYNFIGVISIVPLILLLFLPFNILILIYKKKKAYIIIFNGFLIIFLIYIFFFFSKNYLDCNDWGKGLNQTYIENKINKHGCSIKIPKVCPYKLGHYVLDFSKWNKIKCHDNQINTKNKILFFSESIYINKNTSRIGFPLLNKDKELFITFKQIDNQIKKYVKKNLIDMDNTYLLNNELKNKIPEIIVDYTHNPYGEMVINLTYNETLSIERKKKEKNVTPYSENIIILYIDSVSRAYSIRQLKKTLSFFEQFMSFKGGFHKRFPSQNFHSFQFFKYHSFIGYTTGNYPKMFYGENRGPNITRITKHFKDNGYVISYSNDMCLRDMTITNHNLTFDEIGDHEFLICDPNRIDPNIHTIRCLYNKLGSYYLYEYGKQFWLKYSKNRKLLIIASMDGHEGTLEILKYVDNIIYTFLNDLYNKNLLKDSSIFLLSDHGTTMPSPYYFTLFYQYEGCLPMLYIIINDRKNIPYNEQYKFIHQNQQILITSYDIYNTLGHLLFGSKYDLIANKTKEKETPKSKYGISLFNKIESKHRIPKNYENMEQNVCV